MALLIPLQIWYPSLTVKRWMLALGVTRARIQERLMAKFDLTAYCLVLTGALALYPTTAVAQTYIAYTVKRDVQIRSDPGSGKVLGTVRKGRAVDGTGNFSGRPLKFEGPPICQQGWCRIAFERKYGYIPADSIQAERGVLPECDNDDIELGTCF